MNGRALAHFIRSPAVRWAPNASARRRCRRSPPSTPPPGSRERDGAAWAARLTDVVRALALDLQEAAVARAAADARAVAIYVAVTALLTLVSAGLAVVIARRVARPASVLESVARRIHAGELAVQPVPVTGPREVAATVEAFNDMASTLAAVEQHIAALAGDPSAATLDQPLPGRTGVAIQRAIDRLRSSIHEAEAHRAELFEQASQDSLTGLLNRSAAFAAIDRELARAERDGDDLLALYIDLDDLKPLNESHGHAIGDQAILLTAEALVRAADAAMYEAKHGGRDRVAWVDAPAHPG